LTNTLTRLSARWRYPQGVSS